PGLENPSEVRVVEPVVEVARDGSGAEAGVVAAISSESRTGGGGGQYGHRAGQEQRPVEGHRVVGHGCSSTLVAPCWCLPIAGVVPPREVNAGGCRSAD